MRERPILFSSPMVRAILAGRKTQTRRVARPRRKPSLLELGAWSDAYVTDPGNREWLMRECPFGDVGDRLWVRESLRPTRDEQEYIVDWHYAADGAKVPRCPDLAPQFNDGMAFAHLARAGVPSIHMPRWASRITLEVTGVRVERLQSISEADAEAEGCPCYVCGAPLDGHSESDCHCFHRTATASDYRDLWEQINGAGSWEANPWVWVVEFKRIEQEAAR